jgi:hypothetical protein
MSEHQRSAACYVLEHQYKWRMLDAGTRKQVPQVKCWNISTRATCSTLEHQHKCRMLKV